MTASTLELVNPRRSRGELNAESTTAFQARGEERWFDEEQIVEGAHTFFSTPASSPLPTRDAAGDQIRYNGFVQQNIIDLLSVVHAHAIRVARDKEHLTGGRKEYLGYEVQADRLQDYMYWAPSWSKYIPVITFDVDNPYDHTTCNDLPLPPNWLGENPEKHTWQGMYFLDSPVAGATNPLRRVVSSMRTEIHKALNGDPNFVGNVARTPGHEAYEWHHQHDYRYSLSELMTAFLPATTSAPPKQQRFVNLRTRQAEMTRDDAGLIMRQMFLFEKGRLLAYSRFASGAVVDERWLLHEVLTPLEAELAKLEDREPIPVHKVKSIARSIVNFCNTKMSRDYARGNGVSFYTHEQRIKGGRTQGRINASNGHMGRIVAVRWESSRRLGLPAFPREASVKGGQTQGAVNAKSGHMKRIQQQGSELGSMTNRMNAIISYSEIRAFMADTGLSIRKTVVALGVGKSTVERAVKDGK
ncbi:replication initiation protein [Microbacterium sp. NPDC008134]|uniref:replication initiation protein n=1 Tax=Microbacterium sp. NPDC008134 TaxID=3364183 RepID=UPI0036EAC190